MTDAQIAALEKALADAAGTPRTISVDGELVTQHALSELLAAAKYANSLKQMKTNGGLVMRKFVPPGAP